MNDRLLLNRRINFNKDYIEFLHFIHPRFCIVSDISNYDNPFTEGIIYIGTYVDDIISKLNEITPNWIIVNSHHYDLDLSTNEGLVKNLLPLHYVHINTAVDKNSSSKNNIIPIYNNKNISYAYLLEKIKICLVDNSPLKDDDIVNSSVYGLFSSIVSTPDALSTEFFRIVNKKNVSQITSSILTFLNKVQSNNIRGEPVYYARLITQSNRRYGKHIQKAISEFVKSKTNKEISLYRLLMTLNKAR
jgi:hypothetical protein